MKESSAHTDAIQAVINFAKSCDYEKEHSEQVTKLALNLFDELRPLHKMGEHEKFLLESGGLLHDIGWAEGQKGHHKVARDLVLGSDALPFNAEDKTIVALIARYHRKSLPGQHHPVFSGLSAEMQAEVKILGGILRISDGLDRTHCSVISAVECDIYNDRITIRCRGRGDGFYELQAASKKSDLLKTALKKDIQIVPARF